MKYGLKETQESPPDDEKKLSSEEDSTPLKEVDSVVVKLVATENKTESSDVNTGQSCIESTEVAKSESVSQPVNIESINNNQNTAPEKSEIETLNAPVQPTTQSYTEMLAVQQIDVMVQQINVTDQQQHECESSVMVCDVTTNDTQALEESVMEVVPSNDDENSEVEMISHPPTPNDVDMGGMVETQDAFIKSNVNYNLKNAPIVELSRYSWGSNDQKYLRGCVFSPDGTCILTSVNKDGMHVIELPLSLYENESVSVDRPLDILTTAVHVPEGGTVYDYCWYPFMNSTLPETCCFLSSRQHEPIQLWDAFDGKLRCTYRGYDAVDEVESALSVCFSIDASQVIAGYKKTLKVFRTDVPGRDYTSFPLKSPATCLAVNSNDDNLIAIGSWNSFVTLHDVRSPKLTMTDKLVKHTGGVTLMKFSSDGLRLITGARKDNKLLGWDMRNVTEPLFNLNRNVATNQKIYFDLSSSDQWLVSGDTNGILHVFDVEFGTKSGKFPDYQYQLHRDCCNGVSLHPTRPIFATTSGQYHFIGIEEDIEENSLIFWWCGNSDCE